MHRNFLRIVGQSRPSIFDFLIGLQNLEHKTYMDLYRTINNIVSTQPRKPKYEVIDKKLSQYEDDLQNDHNIERFLSRASNLYKG